MGKSPEQYTRANAYWFDPEDISEGDNPRRYPPEEIAELAKLILEHGQLKPIILRRNEQKQLVTVDGARRLAAIRYINDYKLSPERQKIRAEIRPDRGADSFDVSVVANDSDKPFSPIDWVHIITRYEKQGKTRAEIAGILRKSEGWLSTTMSLAQLPAKIQRKVHTGEIAASTAYEMVKMTDEEREQVLAAKSGKLEREQVRQVKRKTSAAKGPKTRSLKEVRGAFIAWEGSPATVGEKTSTVSGALLQFFAGKISPEDLLGTIKQAVGEG
jgi:ParB/RepB/Spo0J family partition protein